MNSTPFMSGILRSSSTASKVVPGMAKHLHRDSPVFRRVELVRLMGKRQAEHFSEQRRILDNQEPHGLDPSMR